MASILDRYGIKEVADVVFYDIISIEDEKLIKSQQGVKKFLEEIIDYLKEVDPDCLVTVIDFHI